MSRKINIYLMGGAGNNLFQLALGTEFKNRGYIVVYNTYLRKPNILTRLLGWSIHEDKLINFLLESELHTSKLSSYAFFQVISSFIFYRLGLKDLFSIQKDSFHTTGNTTHYIGYWQSGPHLNPKVYDQLQIKIMEYFSRQGRIRNNDFEKKIVCHYRAGDFPEGWRLSKNYYDNALSYFPNLTPLIVTNDIASTKEIGFEGLDIVSSSFDDDLFVLFSANILVCSNSTLCYWAATLGNCLQVIVPSHLNENRLYNLKFFKKEIFTIPVVYD